MTPEELSAQVRQAFAYAARYVSLLVSNNPTGTSAALLTRPDVDAVLAQTLDAGRELAADAIRAAWAAASGPQSPYLTWLIDDVDRSYDALGLLRNAIRRAWASVPPQGFVPGQTPPGQHPSQRAAEERAAAVRAAILEVAAEIALRNQLSLGVATVAAETLAGISHGQDLERAGEHVWKQWLCSHQPPDDRTCHWCRALNGMIIPLRANFPAGTAADLTGHGRLTRPPRVYHGILPGPPRHPRCRCRLRILTNLPARGVSSGSSGQGGAAAEVVDRGPGGEAAAPSPANASGFLAAADIRALPQDKYDGLRAFLLAAVHELGQVLARLRKVVGHRG